MTAETTDAERLESAHLAHELRLAVTVLIRRFRAEATIPIPQLQAMGLIARSGAQTTSQLAAHERMRPQSMAQTVAQLEAAGFVERRADPADGRQQLIHLTALGETRLAEFRRAAEAWLADEIADRFDDAERRDLARGLELVGRLLD